MNENNEIILKDISNDLLSINKVTIEHLFSLKDDNALVLYLFYYKTAKWQGTNQVFANDMYIRKSLNWGSNKVTNAKNTLKNSGLIEIVQKRENNKISGWYIKVKYLESNNTQKQELQNTTSCNQETNTIDNNINAYNNNTNTKEIDNNKLLSTKKKRFVAPSLEEVKQYCEERNNNIDPQYFIDFYESKDWYVGKNKMKDWKASIRTWEKNNTKKSNKSKLSFEEMWNKLEGK